MQSIPPLKHVRKLANYLLACGHEQRTYLGGACSSVLGAGRFEEGLL
jgi:hypothetical protein